METIRTPRQKRSIATKEKISRSGFELFCEKGYRRTNTIEIARHAGVSVGAVYSYFNDKRDIFIDAFTRYLDVLSSSLFAELAGRTFPTGLAAFIGEWISSYTRIYAKANYALMQLRLMMMEDEDVNRHFCSLENQYVSGIAALLKENGFNARDATEKVYIACILVDTLNREKNEFPHEEIGFETLRYKIETIICSLLS